MGLKALGSLYLAIGGIFAVVAAIPFWVEARGEELLWLLFVYPSCDFLLLGCLHFYSPGLARFILGKNAETGRIHLVSWFLLAPYFAWHHAVYRVRHHCCLRGERHYDLVASGNDGRRYFVGRYPRSLPAGCPSEATVIVDLTAEFVEPRSMLLRREYICLPCIDQCMPPAPQLLDLCKRMVAMKGAVFFVHCANGRGRSSSVVAVCMVLEGVSKSLEDAFDTMRLARPQVHVQESQREILLAALELEARGNEVLLDTMSVQVV